MYAEAMASSLPPLNSIRVFAAVARRKNFARAAEDLNVTQSAVSKQILALEEHIGTKLFERKAQGVELTHEGIQLQKVVAPALEDLARGFERYSRRAPRSKTVRVTTTASFSAMVLIPHLAAFEQEFPDIQLEILTGDRLFDLHHEEIDIAVRFSDARLMKQKGVALGRHTLTPVASQTLVEKAGGKTETLLSSARRVRLFLQDEWSLLKSKDDSYNEFEPLILENFFGAATAVQHGIGVACLPTVLLHPQTTFPGLVPIKSEIPWSEGFWLLTQENRLQTKESKLVENWIRNVSKG